MKNTFFTRSKVTMASMALLALSALYANPCAATTITTNTTWNASSNPGTITDNLIIASGATLTIQGTGYGTFTQYCDANITVEPGATLVIDGATIYMDYNSGPLDAHGNVPLGSIVVAANTTGSPTGIGGRLTMKDNATITGFYNVYNAGAPGWYGIFVEGTPTIGQYAITGQINIDNSTITNATYGVANFNYTKETAQSTFGAADFYNNPNVSTGGVIHASNMTFLDNIVDVTMYNYRPHVGTGISNMNDASSFIKCVFDVESAEVSDAEAEYGLVGYPDYTFFTHAYLQNVQGVAFLGCQFKTGNHGVRNFSINAVNAGFRVDHYCSTTNLYFGTCTGTITPSSIENNGTGMWQASINVSNSGFSPVSIQNTTFTGMSSYPIALNGCLGPVVSNNTVTVDGNTGTWQQSAYGLGIALNHCNDYTVSGNTVSGINHNSSWPIAGITIANSGANYNLVNNNTCANLDYGIQAIGDNRTGTNGAIITGLTFYCNNMTTNTLTTATDLSAMLQTGTSTTGTSGIALDQGSPLAAANSFASHTLWNLYNTTGNSFIYYYDPLITSQIPTHHSGESISPDENGRSCTPSILGTQSWAVGNIAITNVKAVINGGTTGIYASPFAMMEAAAQTADSIIYGQIFTTDSVIHYDTLQTLLDTLTYLPDYQVQLASLLAEQGQYANAVSLLGTILSVDSLDSMTTVRINNLVAVYNVYSTLVKDGGDWSSLSTDDVNTIYNIDSTDFGFAQAVTHQLLRQYTGQFYPPLLELIATGARSLPTLVNSVQPVRLDVYPNPVNDQLNINTFDQVGMTLVLSDISGRQLLSLPLQAGVNVVDMQQYTAGMYIAKIYSNGQLSKVEKISKY